MSGRWWRAYSRARHDPKLLRLTDRHFRWWFNFVCAAADNDGWLPEREDLATEFRATAKTIDDAINELDACGLLDWDEGTKRFRPHNWNGLQYKTDVSTERVKQFRERQRNVSETPSESETESDTESEQNRTEKIPRSRKTKLPEDWQPSEELLAYAAEQGCSDPKDTAERFRLHHQSKGTLGVDWSKGFQFWCRNQKNFARPQQTNFRPSGPVETHTDGDGQWGARMRGWHQSKFWKPYDWGPEPGHERCLVPPHLLKDAA